MWQAENAGDPAIRRVMARVARDETRHAALSFRIARYFQPHLSPTARRRIATARSRAIAELEREIDAPVPPELVALAGMPDRACAGSLLAALDRELWSNAPRRFNSAPPKKQNRSRA